ASPEEVSEMQEILQRQESKVSRGELAIAEDAEFHYSVAVASGNSVVLKVIDILMALLRDTRERSLQLPGRQEKSLAGHRRILKAIKVGDAAAAQSAMRRHIEDIEAILLQQLRKQTTRVTRQNLSRTDRRPAKHFRGTQQATP
ncbi:MAG TPA: FCD domain-containing protein, partial [Terriglobales bacterium]